MDKLLNSIDDIKEKLTSEEYKKIMEQLQAVNESVQKEQIYPMKFLIPRITCFKRLEIIRFSMLKKLSDIKFCYSTRYEIEFNRMKTDKNYFCQIDDCYAKISGLSHIYKLCECDYITCDGDECEAQQSFLPTLSFRVDFPDSTFEPPSDNANDILTHIPLVDTDDVQPPSEPPSDDETA